ncbi:MAG: hypothetical protein UW22_C0002G0012 [Candidatus Gottesmanbacteria bacterium GW2011_GWB1_44_11c]|uniref:Uncharacterized protein n=2 Tax=Candidatus Gottesmaniibacteriota TaxID=1752720 RepID=A0A0G1IRB2_9BACT|nr:MAG: hypothetical protein UW22_C0002G0012 [Candidatus Gottesmanbacteria bacterium GW2011_GWB1_44_11c]KKT61498.1 MAG: hypothetical protein UW52_C0002G0012 [Candidatus Gottesmanbacteria bacterium GW2011_GWA1_44_24b]
MAERQIAFKYEGQRFVVDQKAYDLNRIVLPDGRMLEANSWLESMPPQPKGLHEVLHLFKDLEPEEIAKQLNAILAVEVIVH